MTDKVERARVRFRTSQASSLISFEPLAQGFQLSPGEELVLDLPVADLKDLELVIWEKGLDVWLPYPGDHIVYDKDGTEIGRL